MDFDELPSAQQGIDLADELFGQPLPLLASFDHDLEPQPAPSVAMDEDPTLTSAPAPDALEDDDDEAGDDLFGDDGLDGDDECVTRTAPGSTDNAAWLTASNSRTTR